MEKNITLGRKIAELREARGYSQYQLGKLVGLSDKAVSKWENDKSIPRRTVVEKLSGYLGFDLNLMMSDDNLTPDEADELREKQRGLLWAKAEKQMKEIYGEDPELPIYNRFLIEQNTLLHSDAVILFDILAKVSRAAKEKEARFTVDGSVDESFVAWLLKATEINPLEAHLYCPKCHRTVFHREVRSGWDLPETACECGARMIPDGQDLPFETCILGAGDPFEAFNCQAELGFMAEAEKIILSYGEQFYTMERYHEDPETETMINPETGKKEKVQYLPMSSLMFYPKKKAAIRKPEKITGPAEVTNWGIRAGRPVIVLRPGLSAPDDNTKASVFRGTPEELTRQDIMARALKDYWTRLPEQFEIYGIGTRIPDIEPWIGKLTFDIFIALLCSVTDLYMTSGPEELAEKCGMKDLTELPLACSDLWRLINRCSEYPGYMRGAAGEVILKTYRGQYLQGIGAKDRKLFRQLNLPEWYETFAANIMAMCPRSQCVALGIRLLEDARRKIRDGK